MKVIHVVTGLDRKACPFCTRTTDEDVKYLHYITLYHCICPRVKPTFDDMSRQCITEPCDIEDYERCPMLELKR